MDRHQDLSCCVCGSGRQPAAAAAVSPWSATLALQELDALDLEGAGFVRAQLVQKPEHAS